jgi:pimeloyl-ACP methyl ester carboxylesterase
VSALLIDGYPVYSEDERTRRVATYFPPYEVRWDGAHLLWLWYRYREQYLFWPWNIPGEVTQARCDVPDAEFLHEGVVDMLRAGNGYRLPYAAAFRCRSKELVPRLRAPTYFLAYPDDSLTANLKLLGELPPSCHIEPMPIDRAAGTEKEIAILRRHTPASANASLRTSRRSHGITRSYVDADGVQVALRTAGPQSGRPLLVVPPVPGSASMLFGEIEALGKKRSVLAFDVPGCGDSDSLRALTVPEMARVLRAAMEVEGVKDADVYAMHGGCAVAMQLGATGRMVLEAPARAHRDDPFYADRYAPPIEPRWDGTHLLSLWHAARNRRLFRPWFDQRLEVRYTDALSLDVEALNREVLAYLESWRTYHQAWRAVLAHPAGKGTVVAQPRDEFVAGEMLPEAMLPRTQRILDLLGDG